MDTRVGQTRNATCTQEQSGYDISLSNDNIKDGENQTKSVFYQQINTTIKAPWLREVKNHLLELEITELTAKAKQLSGGSK